ncbi:hypothetical protein ACLK17_25795 [Escherichia coli]
MKPYFAALMLCELSLLAAYAGPLGTADEANRKAML